MKFRSHGAMENPFGLVAAKAAYTHGASWLDELREYLLENYRQVQQGVPSSLRVYHQQGTFLAWMDGSALGNSRDLQHYFYEQRKLGLQMGPDFGPGGEGHVRLNFALPRAELIKILDKMQ